MDKTIVGYLICYEIIAVISLLVTLYCDMMDFEDDFWSTFAKTQFWIVFFVINMLAGLYRALRNTFRKIRNG